MKRVVDFVYFISAFTDGLQLNESEQGGTLLQQLFLEDGIRRWSISILVEEDTYLLHLSFVR